MLLTRSDLAGIIVNKPVIDARTDMTRPPTGVVDLANNTYSPIMPIRPLETWEKVVIGAGVVGAVGATIWLLSRMPRSPVVYSSSLRDAPTVVVRRSSPVVIYEDEPDVVVDEAPALLVNPSKRKKTKGRKSR